MYSLAMVLAAHFRLHVFISVLEIVMSRYIELSIYQIRYRYRRKNRLFQYIALIFIYRDNLNLQQYACFVLAIN